MEADLNPAVAPKVSPSRRSVAADGGGEHALDQDQEPACPNHSLRNPSRLIIANDFLNRNSNSTMRRDQWLYAAPSIEPGECQKALLTNSNPPMLIRETEGVR